MTALLSVRDLVKHFPARRRSVVHAVCGVSFDVAEAETVALVGESGCGKTTTGRLLLGLLPATSGAVRFAGADLTRLSARALRPLRRDLQIVFQDPVGALDPRMTIGEIVAEPLRIHRRYDPDTVTDLLGLVGVDPADARRLPHEFSGGQRQRVGIARALALRPRLLVLDEPVSALDVSIRAGVLNLLADVRAERGLAYLFISHDLAVVRHVAHRVAVMYLGRLVEVGPVERVFQAAAHPYTQALISAIPLPDPRRERARRRVPIAGEVPSAVDPPSGCRFRTRCPRYATDLAEAERRRCAEEVPALVDHGGEHLAACHYATPLRLF